MIELSNNRHAAARAATALVALGAAALLPFFAHPAHAAAARPREAEAPPLHAVGAAAAVTARAAGTPGRDSSADPSVWDDLAMCESSGDWHINTGNGFFGGLQFYQPTWERFGGRQYARRADLASPGAQITIARSVQREQGWGAWPACAQRLGLNGRAAAGQSTYGRATGQSTYTVQPGENLSSIAADHHIDGGWVTLYQANRQTVGADPDTLGIGAELTLP